MRGGTEALEKGRGSTHRVLEVEVLGVSGHWHPRQESQDVIVCLENRRSEMDSGPGGKMRREFSFSLLQRSEGPMRLAALLISSSFPKSHFPVFLVSSTLPKPPNLHPQGMALSRPRGKGFFCVRCSETRTRALVRTGTKSRQSWHWSSSPSEQDVPGGWPQKQPHAVQTALMEGFS